ncbi:MAG: hypothetical protein E7376_04935 [Clostridiales bacterium]|nr:hypothetical protein [Clostridiales bacterium]
MNKEFEFRYFKDIDTFKRNIQWLIDNHFTEKKDNIIHQRFVYAGIITKDVALNYYLQLKKSYERYRTRNLSNPNRAIQLPVYKDFQHMLSLMEVLNKNELKLDDLNHVMQYAEIYFDRYFNMNKFVTLKDENQK